LYLTLRLLNPIYAALDSFLAEFLFMENPMCEVSTEVIQPRRALFSLGQLLITPGAMQLLEEAQLSLFTFLARHVAGDWGDVCDEDRKANDEAIGYGNRLMSVYPVGNEKIWIITESDRNATTVLLPEEY
jgi:hypothetical protein